MANDNISKMTEELLPSSTKKEYDAETLENMTNIEVRELAKQWGVSLSQCQNLQEMKDRLRYDFMKRNGRMEDKVVSKQAGASEHSPENPLKIV